MLQKNTQNIYQWSIGKTEKEVQEQIELLQLAINMAKAEISFAKEQTIKKALRKEIVKTMNNVIKKNEEAISYLKMDLAMKSVLNMMTEVA
jgi:hypothetical protein